MFPGKLLISGLITLGLGFAPVGVFAVEPGAHTDAVEIKLDNGKKWPTDAALRRGMSEIRLAVADALTPIHRNEFSPAVYEALAGRVQVQIDYIIANCRLPEQADHQLHMVLEQMLDGIAAMKTDAGQGAGKLAQALDVYGAHFDHAGWQPLVR